ncbi:MAG: hypothetical protein KBA60_12030 [Flavobacteriales bacterium]|nr:hypothetical protein [Flavobacteriales bacterium]MBP7156733.1 hypothetical protein [Flavobacteriales bacterium]
MKALPLVVALTCALMVGLAFAQAPPIRWQRSLGGSNIDQGNAVRQTSDGGFLVAGEISSNNGDITENYGGVDCWVVKLDPEGAMLWQRTYGGSHDDHANDIRTTSDGGSVFVGSTVSPDGDVTGLHGTSLDIWIVKLDSAGALEWQRVLGGSGADLGNSVLELSDGGYLVSGSSRSDDGDLTSHNGTLNQYDAWLIRLDTTGNIVWQRTYGGTSDETIHALEPLENGGFIVAGESSSNDGDVSGAHGGIDAWVFEVDADGNLLWQRALGGTLIDRAFAIQQLPGGGFIVAGESSSNNGDVYAGHGMSDVWVVHIDAMGAVLWQRALGGSVHDLANAMELTSDGGSLIAGFTYSNNGNVAGGHGGTDAWLLKLNGEGTMLWQKAMGGTADDKALGLIITDDGGSVIVGRSSSNNGDVTENAGFADVWVVRLDVFVGIDEFRGSPLSVSPNPSRGLVRVIDPTMANGVSTIVLSDLSGRRLLERGWGPTDQVLDLGEQPSGVYVLSLFAEGVVWNALLVLE